MKTTKRSINWHGCTDGVDFETYRDTIISQHARWTRKNREARLRNRIRVGLYHQMMEKYWKDCTMDCLEALTMREDMDGTYGQDIEGS